MTNTQFAQMLEALTRIEAALCRIEASCTRAEARAEAPIDLGVDSYGDPVTAAPAPAKRARGKRRG